jgi:hypothetical protein
MQQDSSADGISPALLAPGTALLFSVFVAILAPRYAHWFGATMPAFTRTFIAYYPLWIAFGAIAVMAQVCVRVLYPKEDGDASFGVLDGLLAIASVGVIAAGIIALALPLIAGPGPAG